MDHFTETSCSANLPLSKLAAKIIAYACNLTEQTWDYERSVFIEETFLVEEQIGIVPPWFEGQFSLPILF